MKTADFDYPLPQERIAQAPAEPRDSSRLLVLRRGDGSLEQRTFSDLPDLLQPGDVLVLNRTRVLPARLQARKATGGKAELLLLRRLEPGLWQALVRGRKLRAGTNLSLDNGLTAEVGERLEDGSRLLRLASEEGLERLGQMPLPPYIKAPLQDPERYQTVYGDQAGSVAASTAGLHFTPDLLARLEEKGVRLAFVTLHLGLASFRPVTAEEPAEHRLPPEWGEVKAEVVQEIIRARQEGGRVVCVGTSTVRALERAARDGTLAPFSGWMDLFILPGYQFRVADALITNFHLPRSTNLMLVAAFADWERVRSAYQEAMRAGYRFLSFGDAMLVL